MKPGYLRFKVTEGQYATIYPLPCLHVGAPQSDAKFIKEHLKRIQDDPSGYWVYMGDGGECVTKNSKGDIYGQLMGPQQQLDLLVELFKPIREKGILGIRGNHGNRVYKETGLSFDKALCTALGIPYMGVNTFLNLVVNRSSYDLFFHHGIDSGVSSQSKVNKAETFKQFTDADAIFTAHSHVALDLPPAILNYADNNSLKVKSKLRFQYMCGTGYDSRTGYAADKGYPPLIPAFIKVSFDGRIIRGRPVKTQTYSKFISNGQHEVDGDFGFIPENTEE